MDAISGKSFWNFNDDDGDFKGSDDSDATEEMSDTSSEEDGYMSETGVDLCMKRPEVGDRVYCHFDPEDKEAWYRGRIEGKFWKKGLLHYSIQYDDGDRDEEFNAAQGIATEAQYHGRRSNDEVLSSGRRDSPITDAKENPRPTTIASSTTSKPSSDVISNRKRKYDHVNISTTSERRLVDTSMMAQQSKTKTTITPAPTKEMITEWKQRHPCIGTGGQELRGGHRKAQCKGCRCCSVCQPPPWCQKPWEHERTERKRPPKTPLGVQQKRDTDEASNAPREHNPRDKRSKLRSNSGDDESGLSMPINSLKKPAATKKIVRSSPYVVRAPPIKSASAKLPRLILEGDRKLLDDFSSKVMEQCRPCWYSESDRSRKNLKTMTFGHGGLECVHCAGIPNGRRFFFGTASNLSKSFHSIPEHLLVKCPKCPEETKKDLRQLQRNLPAPQDKLPGVSRTKYLQRLWYRLQNEGTSEGPAPSIPTVKDPQHRSSDRKITVASSAASKEHRPKRAATADSNNKSRPHRTAPSLPMAAKAHRSTSAALINPGNNSYQHKTPYDSDSSSSSSSMDDSIVQQRRTRKSRSSSSSVMANVVEAICVDCSDDEKEYPIRNVAKASVAVGCSNVRTKRRRRRSKKKSSRSEMERNKNDDDVEDEDDDDDEEVKVVGVRMSPQQPIVSPKGETKKDDKNDDDVDDSSSDDDEVEVVGVRMGPQQPIVSPEGETKKDDKNDDDVDSSSSSSSSSDDDDEVEVVGVRMIPQQSVVSPEGETKKDDSCSSSNYNGDDSIVKQRRTKKTRSSSSSSRAQPTKARKISRKKKFDWEDSDDDSSIGEDLLNAGLSKPAFLVSSAGTVAHLVASPSISEEGGSVGKSKNGLLVSSRPPSVGVALNIGPEGGNNSKKRQATATAKSPPPTKKAATTATKQPPPPTATKTNPYSTNVFLNPPTRQRNKRPPIESKHSQRKFILCPSYPKCDEFVWVDDSDVHLFKFETETTTIIDYHNDKKQYTGNALDLTKSKILDKKETAALKKNNAYRAMQRHCKACLQVQSIPTYYGAINKDPMCMFCPCMNCIGCNVDPDLYKQFVEFLDVRAGKNDATEQKKKPPAMKNPPRGDQKREGNDQSNRMARKGKMIEYLLSMLGFDKLDLGEQEAVSEAIQLLQKPNDIFTSTLLASIEYNNPNFRMHEEVADEFVKQVKKLKEVARKRKS